MELIKFILATGGLTWILTRSNLLKPLREFISTKAKSTVVKKDGFVKRAIKNSSAAFFNFFHKMLSCYACTGFWCGVVVYFIIKFDLDIVIYAFIGSISSLIIISYNQYLNRR